MSSALHGAGWRTHRVLDESDEGDSPAPRPDRFRKLRASTSLNSLRMSLRKRLPLKAVQTNVSDTPSWEALEARQQSGAVRRLTRSARNSIGGMCQKIQKRRVLREECLMASPGKPSADEEDNYGLRSAQAAHTPRKVNVPPNPTTTPRRTAKHTPRSAIKKTPRAARTPEPSGIPKAGRSGGSRRQLVRMVALRSPYASPNTLIRRRQFDQDLDSVSTGLGRLKQLSQAFDEVIGQEERRQAIDNYRRVMLRSYGSTKGGASGKASRTSIRLNTTHIRQTVGSWKDVALSSIRKRN